MSAMLNHFRVSTPSATTIPITGAKVVVYSLDLQLEAGDIITATSEQQFTNENNNNVGVWSQITMTLGVNTQWLTQKTGRNITPDMHHDIHVKTGSIVAPETGLWTLYYRAWARSTQGTLPISVDTPYYGFLSAVVGR